MINIVKTKGQDIELFIGGMTNNINISLEGIIDFREYNDMYTYRFFHKTTVIKEQVKD